MPDTPRLLRPDQMQAIREQEFTDGDVAWAVSRLLEHIDAILASVETLLRMVDAGVPMDSTAVRAILNGEPHDA